MASSGTILQAHDLACVRGERPVFRGVSFALEPGGALVLRGPNGSGKSSLLRILAGYLHPVNGMVAWGGENMREAPDAHRARTHYVGHLEAVKPALTVTEHLAFWARAKGFSQAAEGILAALDLKELADVPGRFLSAGQKRRLSLTRLLASPAELWLLDEPSITLDVESARRLETMLAGHRKQGGMTVVATHTKIALPEAKTINMASHAVPAQALLGAMQKELGELDYGKW